MIDDENDRLARRISSYHLYWSRLPSPPKTFGVLRAAFEFFKQDWVPPKAEAYVINSNLASERYHFENIFFFVGQAEWDTLIENDKVNLAHEREARSRLYRMIHRGDVFDHLMPAESRAYWNVHERKAKVLFGALVASIVYLALVCVPSWLYGSFWPAETLVQTYVGPHELLVRDPSFRNAARSALLGPSTQQSASSKPLDANEFVSLYKEARSAVDSQVAKLPSLSSVNSWKLSNETQQKEAATAALFYLALERDTADLNRFLDKSLLIVTPLNNKLEVATQLAMILCIWAFLMLYFSRKYELSEIHGDCTTQSKPMALVDCAEILGSSFRGRKYLHYLIAGFSAIVATCIHFYHIGDANIRIATPIAELVHAVPYDYRLTTVQKPVFIVHWLLQFGIVFLFVLMGWHVGVLGRCLTRLQRHIGLFGWARADQLKTDHLRYRRSMAFWLCFTGALIILGGLSTLKLFAAQEVGLADHYRIAYIFSPALTVCVFLIWALALPVPYATYEAAKADAIKRRRLLPRWTKEDLEFAEATMARFSSTLGIIPKIREALKLVT